MNPMKLSLKAVDWIAMLAVVIGFMIRLVVSAYWAAFEFIKALYGWLIDPQLRLFLMAGAVGCIWCFFRWKAINHSPSSN